MKDVWQKNEVEIVQIISANSQFKEVLSTVSFFKCHATKWNIEFALLGVNILIN